ncbi:TonB-dependent receptor [Mucilaginibacter sp. BJC16-A38]|uniref:TonB-dependent receptor n=1 Tax=Mucilaginibacter phenanthrenivorans TaxID=1234842 RepID=UPI00215825CF|nr:TonB-dependent receptor [Mucilaginibacter phenanthrenivorans]MCR8556464.1 TonB-dependent receptor [Mucilaginibacter phenanthrenivorans]
MKFNCMAVPVKRHYLFKILLAMKLTAVLVFAALLNVSAKTYSQNISIHQSNISVDKILKLIKKQTGYNYFYDEDAVAKTSKVNIDVNNASVEEALNLCFKNQPLTYRIFQQTIVVKAKDETKPVSDVAQKVSGTVSDTKGPLPGVNVKVKGTTIGTVTDVNGKYVLNDIDGGATLVFTFVGYNTQEVAINNRETVDVKLVESQRALSEVVVVGYGTSKRVDLTGAVGSVNEKQLQERPAINLEQELAGKIAGVNVSTNSGAPGGATKIRIRGYSSINSNTDPLYVVDGVVWTEGGASINPNDVASIDVLKDASSTAIYGTRGANGVILVTTKRGSAKQGGTVTYDAYGSVGVLARKLKVLDAKQFLAVEDQSYANIKKYDPAGWAAGKYADDDPKVIRTALIGKLFDANLNPLYDVDWQDATTRHAFSQNHNLSFTDGTEKMNYGLFLNYGDDEGIIINSYQKRYNARLTFDNQVKSWLKVGATINYDYRETRTQDDGTGGNNIPRMLVEMPSIIPIKYPDGTYGKRTDYPNMEGGDNPVAQANEIVSLHYNRVFSGNGYANINFFPGFDFRTTIGVTTSSNTEPHSQTGLVGGSTANQTYSSASINQYNNTFWQWENHFTYNKKFNGVHSLNVVAGTELQNFSQLSSYGSSQDLSDNYYSYYNLGAGAIPGIPTSGYDAWQMQSFFGRVNYGYNDKYLLTVTGREDGSSRFGSKSKYGFFPSAAVAWRISQEDFLKNNKTISDLKLRLSYGLTGNSEIGEYRSPANISTNNYVFGGAQSIGTHQTSIGNDNLQWEKTAEWDLGLSFGLFNNRITVDADAYLKKTKKLLLNAPLPETSGFTSVFENIGSIQNKGFELTLNTVNVKSENFSWNSSFNISLLANRILNLGASNDDIFLAPTFLSQFNLMRVGLSAGTFWGYKVLGTWGTAEATEAAKYGLLPGDLKIWDKNGDGKITADDKTVLGKSLPDGYGTFLNTFRYKNFDLAVELQFDFGNQVMNLTRHSGQDRTGQANSYASVLNAWTPTNQNTDIAEDRPAYVRYQTEIYSTKVENGSFVRGKTVTLGYNFPSSIVQKLKMSRLRIYAQAQNLFLITKYTGYDPETSTYNGSSNYTQGILFYDYPKPHTFLLGLNASF